MAELGIYVSIPFCKQKCSYCNFASGVFSSAKMQGYVDRLCQDIRDAGDSAIGMGATLPRGVNSIYLGGGTPTILRGEQLQQVFRVLRHQFRVADDAEVTVECAPGTLTPPVLTALLESGVNRVSFGVQSFQDAEAKSVGRAHDRETVFRDIATLRHAGIHNINLDLIAGLPHQTEATWQDSVTQAIATGVPHVSVYMLEVDEDSRLGRELTAGGVRYHAHHVPDEQATADFYQRACELLGAAGILQYEISNFAQSGFESRHNLKYWTRQPYIGFGLDAHSMLPVDLRYPNDPRSATSVRFSASDDLDAYLSAAVGPGPSCVTLDQELDEEFFLGLRLNRGVDIAAVEARQQRPISAVRETLSQLLEDGLLESRGHAVSLTSRGRLVSNDVFARLLHDYPR
jgi:oxygen-independent coproporphyrinogen-3 oxidase